jgi:DNA-binding transcriptional MerR regulator
MDFTGLTIEEIKVYSKKQQEESKREYDEFVENLERERLRVQKEIDEKYSKYIDDEETWEEYLDEVYKDEYEEEDSPEGKYIFIF